MNFYKGMIENNNIQLILRAKRDTYIKKGQYICKK
jgi:hypothetical protein